MCISYLLTEPLHWNIKWNSLLNTIQNALFINGQNSEFSNHHYFMLMYACFMLILICLYSPWSNFINVFIIKVGQYLIFRFLLRKNMKTDQSDIKNLHWATDSINMFDIRRIHPYFTPYCSLNKLHTQIYTHLRSSLSPKTGMK